MLYMLSVMFSLFTLYHSLNLSSPFIEQDSLYQTYANLAWSKKHRFDLPCGTTPMDLLREC